MKEKWMITVMIGLLLLSFLSTVASAAKESCTTELNTCTTNLTNAQTNLTNAQANLNTCTTSLGTCNTNLTNAQTNSATCQTNLGACNTNLGTCQTNAQTSLSTCQANLATCQGAGTETTPPPSWYQKLTCDSKGDCPRFEMLADWNNDAVLDNETGLVWEQSPSTALFAWYETGPHCNELTLSNRMGWRVPTLQELLSLVDQSIGPLTPYIPMLPIGNPFSNVQSSYYWSATSIANDDSNAWVLNFNSAYVGPNAKTATSFAWCVRGGQGVSAQ